MILNEEDKRPIIFFLAFVFLFEIIHIAIDTNPPMSLRMVYIGLYLLMCVTHIRLIPLFTAVNLVVERSSIVFAEYLPSSLLFHVGVLFFAVIQLRRVEEDNKLTTAYNYKNYLMMWCMLLWVAINTVYYQQPAFLISGIFALLFFECLRHSNDANIRDLVNCIILAMVFSALSGFANLDKLLSNYASSLSSALKRFDWKDPNYISFFVAIIVLMCVFKIKNRASNRKFYLIASIICVAIIGLMISRGAIVALGIALVFYFRRELFSYRLLGIVVVVSVIGWFLYDLGLLDPIIMRFTDESMADGSGRMSIWKVGYKSFLEKSTIEHFFGLGNGASSTLGRIGDINFSPHNQFIQILFDFGYLGVTIFLCWWASMFFSSKTDEKRAIVLFVMANSMTIVPFTYVTPLWFIIPILIIWDERINKVIYE